MVDGHGFGISSFRKADLLLVAWVVGAEQSNLKPRHVVLHAFSFREPLIVHDDFDLGVLAAGIENKPVFKLRSIGEGDRFVVRGIVITKENNIILKAK